MSSSFHYINLLSHESGSFIILDSKRQIRTHIKHLHLPFNQFIFHPFYTKKIVNIKIGALTGFLVELVLPRICIPEGQIKALTSQNALKYSMLLLIKCRQLVEKPGHSQEMIIALSEC